VVLLLYTADLLRSRLIKALRTALHLALRLSLHRTVGSVSVQSIEVLGAVLIVQPASSNSRGGVEFCRLYC